MFSLREPPRALPEIEPHRLVPVELMAGGIVFVVLGLYVFASDLASSSSIQSKSLILGPTVIGLGVSLSVIGYALRAWYLRQDETGAAPARVR